VVRESGNHLGRFQGEGDGAGGGSGTCTRRAKRRPGRGPRPRRRLPGLRPRSHPPGPGRGGRHLLRHRPAPRPDLRPGGARPLSFGAHGHGAGDGVPGGAHLVPLHLFPPPDGGARAPGLYRQRPGAAAGPLPPGPAALGAGGPGPYPAGRAPGSGGLSGHSAGGRDLHLSPGIQPPDVLCRSSDGQGPGAGSPGRGREARRLVCARLAGGPVRPPGPLGSGRGRGGSRRLLALGGAALPGLLPRGRPGGPGTPLVLRPVDSGRQSVPQSQQLRLPLVSRPLGGSCCGGSPGRLPEHRGPGQSPGGWGAATSSPRPRPRSLPPARPGSGAALSSPIPPLWAGWWEACVCCS